MFPLQYLEVSIEGNKCTALNDSGCQIPIVSNRLFGWFAQGAVGRVNLHVFGQDHVVQASLVNLTVKMCDPVRESECNDMLEIPLVCAVTDLGSVDYDVILPATVVSELQAPAVSVVLFVGDTSDVDHVTQTAESSGQEEPQVADILNVDDIPEDNVEGDSSVLVAEQRADPSLASCWKAAEAGKPYFVIHRGILYHKDHGHVNGRPTPKSVMCTTRGPQSQCAEIGPRLSFWWSPR